MLLNKSGGRTDTRARRFICFQLVNCFDSCSLVVLLQNLIRPENIQRRIFDMYIHVCPLKILWDIKKICSEDFQLLVSPNKISKISIFWKAQANLFFLYLLSGSYTFMCFPLHRLIQFSNQILHFAQSTATVKRLASVFKIGKFLVNILLLHRLLV